MADIDGRYRLQNSILKKGLKPSFSILSIQVLRFFHIARINNLNIPWKCLDFPKKKNLVAVYWVILDSLY